MKKIFFVLIFINLWLGFSETASAKAASRKTAERCLKLAETYLLGGDIESAIVQADIGITYDSSVSDLYYIKAAAMKKNGAEIYEVLPLVKTATELSTWISTNEKGNRILYADLLSDTGKLFEAVRELDRAPFIYSADAESIRIKTYYRIGNDEYVKKAREKINSARRIYKGDTRFIHLFYSFEIARCIRFGKNYVPEMIVRETAEVLYNELLAYDRNMVSSELLCLALFFQEGEKQKRGIKEFDAMGYSDSLFPIVALRAGLISEYESVSRFFEFADVATPLEILKYFSSHLQDEDAINLFNEKLISYSGTLFVDVDFDLQAETEITYKSGRPEFIHFDFDNDGIEDLFGEMDFGELLSIRINDSNIPYSVQILYSPYPYVDNINLYGEQNINFEFVKNAMQISPVYFEMPYELQRDYENKFYVPFVNLDFDLRKMDYLSEATFLQTDFTNIADEKINVRYSILEKKLMSAVYTKDSQIYATLSFENGFPSERLLDNDGNGTFEVTEIYSRFNGANEISVSDFSEEERLEIKNVFQPFDFSETVYCSSILIDYDSDNFIDFSETFLGRGGKKTSFYFLDNRSETYVRYPDTNDEGIVFEDSIFVSVDNGEEKTVTVQFANEEPYAVKFNNLEFSVSNGNENNFYWIGDFYNGETESEVLNLMKNEINGVSKLLKIGDERYLCIKVGKNVFAMFVESQIDKFMQEEMEEKN